MNKYLTQVISNFQDKPDDVFCEFVSESGIDSITWQSLELDCKKVIASLDLQSKSSGVVLIFLPHCKQLFPVFLGSMLGGYVPSFMPCTSPRQDSGLYWKSHQTLINTIKPAVIVTHREMYKEMTEAGLDLGQTPVQLLEELSEEQGEFKEQSEDAIAFLQHSSGTTGLKKGVALSYDAIYKHSLSYGKSLQLTESDVIASWLPTYHDMGLIACFITPVYYGTKTIQLSAFDWLNRPQSFFKLIKEYKATLCWLPNFAFEHMINTLGKHAKKFDLSSMRAFISCSEPCKANTFNRFKETFEIAGVSSTQLHCCYAMAETVFAVTQTDLSKPYSTLTVNKNQLNRGDTVQTLEAGALATELLSCGPIVDELNVQILDSDGECLSEGQVGEIAISGAFLFSGYNKEPDKTAKALSSSRYHTNDLGFLYESRLYVLGRIDDLIIINGRNIYAHQVESLVSKVSGVKPGRTVALSKFDEKIGSEVMIILAERVADDSSLDAEISEKIVQIVQSELDIVPRTVELVSVGTLIKTSSGKISRKENRQRFTKDENHTIMSDAA